MKENKELELILVRDNVQKALETLESWIQFRLVNIDSLDEAPDVESYATILRRELNERVKNEEFVEALMTVFKEGIYIGRVDGAVDIVAETEGLDEALEYMRNQWGLFDHEA